MFEFKLPDLGEGIHEGEVLKWHVQPGDVVVEDAPLVEVETDKAAVTIPSPRGGKVVSVTGEIGDVVATGQIIAVIDDGQGAATAPAAPARKAAGTGRAAEETPAGLPAEEPAGTGRAAEVTPPGLPTEKPVKGAPLAPTPDVTAPAAPAPAATVPGGTVTQPNSTVSGRPVPAAPATRRLARELGVDLTLVSGTGPGGRVTPGDVQTFLAGGSAAKATVSAPAGAAAPAAAPADRAVDGTTRMAAAAASVIPFLDIEPLPDFSLQGPVEVEPLRSIRRKVARKMTTSMILVPHVAHMDDADVTELEEFRLKMKARRDGEPGGKLTLLSFVIRAITAGLRAAPAFNASLDPFREEIIYKKYYNIGFAADTGKGLVVPVIRGTDVKSIREISREIEEKAALAREGKLPLEDMQGGTFTITNVGPLGGTALIPTINYPEVAILGMGRVQEKPVVRDGQIVIRKILPLTLAFDHRVADGADAARFVGELVRNLSDPNLLLLDT
ncbi:MAG: dihydrolipoamide acetyltransferase family protein [Candidatus Latescibacteria bacterium]|nr:dihydrolipoamide acetyltransferase family protein [Candidatus Latescibacterota bacterium]